ncbi:MAG TPA: DUF2127 domain-containing protein, partial [Pyrinomonadaceae bacterium]|nr:DUF2127 domain-containing protein [Pyrinomonadaceae bacterium]
EYPPSYCGGILYVNTFAGKTVALNSYNGTVIWQKRGGKKPSTPAIAGPRLIVSSHDGLVSAYNRFNGRLLWRLKVNAIVSGCIYLPVEAYELIEKPTLLRAGILIMNALIVAYLLYVRFSRTGHMTEDAIHRTEAENRARKQEAKELKKRARP